METEHSTPLEPEPTKIVESDPAKAMEPEQSPTPEMELTSNFARPKSPKTAESESLIVPVTVQSDPVEVQPLVYQPESLTTEARRTSISSDTNKPKVVPDNVEVNADDLNKSKRISGQGMPRNFRTPKTRRLNQLRAISTPQVNLILVRT